MLGMRGGQKHGWGGCQNRRREKKKKRESGRKGRFGIGAATQGLHGFLRQLFSLQCVFQLCFELDLWLPLTKLSPDFRREFQGFKWKGDDVVGAQVQPASTFERSAVNNHHNLKSSRIGACLDLADQTATGNVGWCCLRDQEFRGECENLLDSEAALCIDF